MKEKYIEDQDNFLAKWLIDDISKQELELFKESPNYTTYNAIVASLRKFKVRTYPEQLAYQEFEQSLRNKIENQNLTHHDSDNFLGRWLNDAINPEELKTFEQSEDYNEYASITDGISKFKTKEYDEDVAYSEFKEKLANRSEKNTKVIKLPLLKFAAIAASIVFILGIGYILSNETHKTEFAKLETVTLPDNSIVRLNAKSEITFNTILFQLNRKISLEGEAFFEVEKGSNFTVNTANGIIEVIGTKFNVISRSDYFETSCFEGKVRVLKSENDDLLTSGDKLRYINNKKEKDIETRILPNPKWMLGLSEFKSTPIKYVLKEIENQFNVTFDKQDLKSEETLYSGSFSHDNLKSALENVLLPIGVSYHKDDKTNVITLKTN